MKNLNYFFILVSVLFALTTCDKTDDSDLAGTSDTGALKSTSGEYCSEGEFYSSYFNLSNSEAGFVEAGFVYIVNSETYLHLYLNPNDGFQDLVDNIDIGFYTTGLPANSIPDANSFYYHFTTGVAINYFIDLPIDNIFIENLGAYSSLDCDEQIFIVIHYDALDGSGNPIDIWTGNMKYDGYSGDNYWWYKYIAYTPACCITCDEETAWADGIRYVSKGNWATYTPYNGLENSVILYAGQNMEAGMVYFTPTAGGVNIRIELNTGWSLIDDDEAVKIQGYESAPTGNPSPGLFTTYKGNSLDVIVPVFNFYGVHLDLEHCE